MHTNSRLLFATHALPLFSDGMRILEIGPDGFPSTYENMVRDRQLQWDTLDIHPDARLTYSASRPYSFDIPDESYDLVVSGQVIEHVPKIWRWMPEAARIARVGGAVVTIVPVSWPLHKAPVDCWRMYPDGLSALCEDAGLTVETAHFGSYELPGVRKAIGGRSPDFQSTAVRLYYRLVGLIGMPVEKAFDTIVVARKGGSTADAYLQPERQHEQKGSAEPGNGSPFDGDESRVVAQAQD